MAKPQAWNDIALLVLRSVLGLYLGLAGWRKVQNEIDNGFGSFYNNAFVPMSPDWLPKFLGLPYGYALPWLELIVGGMLVLGLLGRYAAIAGGLMLASFTIALANQHGWKAQPDGPGGPFHGNYIQVAGYFLLIVMGCGHLAVDSLIKGKKKGA